MDIKRVQPVGKDSEDIQPWLGELSARDSKKKDALTDIMVALLEFLQDDEKSVASAALWLKTNLGDIGYVAVLRAQGFGRHLAEAIRLFDEFELTKKGYYVRRA